MINYQVRRIFQSLVSQDTLKQYVDISPFSLGRNENMYQSVCKNAGTQCLSKTVNIMFKCTHLQTNQCNFCLCKY